MAADPNPRPDYAAMNHGDADAGNMQFVHPSGKLHRRFASDGDAGRRPFAMRWMRCSKSLLLFEATLS